MLTDEEKERFLHIIENLKTHTHYVSSLKKIIKDVDSLVKNGNFAIAMQLIFSCKRHL
jgi:hypothetical protein